MNERKFSKQEIGGLEKRFRATLINSVGGFKSLVLLGTTDSNGLSNLAPFSSFFHIGANPALFGLIVRPGTEERHTLTNILRSGSFTVNHVHEAIYVQAHQCSARYPLSQSEFAAVGLTELYQDDFPAPFVQESVVRIGARLREKIDIAINGTTLLLSEIETVSVPQHCISEDGYVDIALAGTITCSGLDSYHTTNRLSRLSYAKADRWPEKI